MERIGLETIGLKGIGLVGILLSKKRTENDLDPSTVRKKTNPRRGGS